MSLKTILGSLLLLNLACLPARAQASDQAIDQAIELTPYLAGLPSVHAGAGDHERGLQEGRFLFDTGGGVTVVTPEFAEAIGCEPWGRITGFRMRGERLDLQRCDGVQLDFGTHRATVPTAGVWDFSEVLPPGAPPLQGSIALDAFAGQAITLDLAGNRLIVETPESLARRTADAIEVPVRFKREASGLALTVFVPVETARGRLWMQLDSGSTGALAIAAHAAELLGLEQVDGRQQATLQLPGGIELQGPAVVQDLIIDGNIGLPLLRQWVITFDLAHGRMWMSPATLATQ